MADVNQISGPSRRQVLGAGAAAVGAAAASSLLPASLHRAMAAPVRPGGLRAVEHVVLLMQENRSFDHYFGRLRGVRGYGDHDPLRRRAGGSVFAQADGARDVLPYSVRTAASAAGRPATDIQYLGGLPHGFSDATQAWADGWYDRWVPAKTVSTMTYYDRRDIPLQYELAETFTTLDAYHCSVFGSTNPNRNYWWTGTTGFEPDGVRRAVGNDAYSYDHAGYDWTTYPERLEAAGVSWQIYQEWDNFTDNAVEYFKPFKAIGTKMLQHVDGGYRTTEEFYDSLHDKPAAEQDALLAQLAQGREALTPAERSLFDRAMYRSRPGTLLTRIRSDIRAGTLPTVVWVVPSAALSEHPGASTPVGSANLVHDLLDVLAADVDTWSRTALLLNFDENDGFFDHVPPPMAPRPASGSDDDWYLGQPVGPGPRVPMTIVSPWTVGGVVDSSMADHTSTLRFLERVTGVQEPNISDWRRRTLSDLTSAFDWDRAGRPPRTQQPDPIPSPITRWHPDPPAEQAMPTQEAGRRPARALGYQPTVSGGVARGVLSLVLGNAGDRAAAFTVYRYGDLGSRPTFHLVDAAARELVDVPALADWDVVVQGPNRFWCELAGTAAGSAAGVDVRPSIVRRRATLGLDLVNTGPEEVTLVVAARRYAGDRRTVRVPAGAHRAITWPTDHGWYDVELTATGDDTFRRRLTGRVETGRTTVTA